MKQRDKRRESSHLHDTDTKRSEGLEGVEGCRIIRWLVYRKRVGCDLLRRVFVYGWEYIEKIK